MAEHDQRSRVVKALQRLDAIPVENGRVWPGTPDVEYVGGWIETKWMREWPARPETIVKLDHPLTAQQRLFHRKRWAQGGVTYVLLQVRNEWLLFLGHIAANVLERLNREDLGKHALRHWRDGLNDKELYECVLHYKRN